MYRTSTDAEYLSAGTIILDVDGIPITVSGKADTSEMESADQALGQRITNEKWLRPALADGTDLNHVRTSGTHPITTAASMKTMLNRPSSATGTGALIVRNVQNTVFHELWWWVSGHCKTASRVTTSGSFGEWEEGVDRAALDTKSSEGHRHEIREINGLLEALEAKASTAGWDSRDPVYFWGDSAVDGGDTNGPWAPAENLAGQLNLHLSQTVENKSRAGDSSNATLLRAGIIRPLGAPVGGTIPASGSVDVETFGLRLQMRAGRTYDVTWAGVPGRLTHVSNDRFTFARTTAGSAVPVTTPMPLVSTHAVGFSSGTHIFLTGGNDWDSGAGTGPEYDRLSHVVSSYVRSVEAVISDPVKHVLIGGAKTRRNTKPGDPNHRFVEAVNTQLKNLYPHIFVDRNQWLVEHGLNILGLTPGVDPLTGIDERDQIKAGIVPARVYADNDYTHAKREIVAAEARDLWSPALTRKGWAELVDPAHVPIYPHPVNVDPAGLVLRKDTTLGTRYLAGETTLFGETDWYDITSLLTPSPVKGSVKIARKGGHIVWRFEWLQYDSNVVVDGQLPAGWRSGVNDRGDVRDGDGVQVAHLSIPWGGNFSLTVTRAGYLDDVVAFPDLGAEWPAVPPVPLTPGV